MKCFEGKRSLNNKVKWFDATNDTKETKQSMLDSVEEWIDPNKAQKAPGEL